MLTQKQIKHLYPGASLVVQGTYIEQHDNGDIGIQFYITSGDKFTSDTKYFHPTCISPKYNPGRKFKKGDLVKKRYIYGRSCDAIGSPGIYTVTEDEDTNGGNVIVKNDTGGHYKVKAVFLQLVTAVEDRPVYSVQESEAQACFDIIRDNLCVMSFPFGAKEHGWYYNETAAKEAAEIECNRLNNLYKQELENNV